MVKRKRAFKGPAMEGFIASLYAKHTRRDTSRFERVARAVSERVAPGGKVLEVAPGPGYLAIEIARYGYEVTALDISHSFVRIAQDNALRAGVHIDVRHGDVADMPFADRSFDFVVSMAAFKNFTNPVGALNEIHRVLKPGGQASIYDLRRDATRGEIDAAIADMHLTRAQSLLNRWIFCFGLLPRAHTREQLERMAAHSSFGRGELAISGIGFELHLTRPA
jgi:ubiquinone/menaquinone biosynthesis C-methylase UbiE